MMTGSPPGALGAPLAPGRPQGLKKMLKNRNNRFGAHFWMCLGRFRNDFGKILDSNCNDFDINLTSYDMYLIVVTVLIVSLINMNQFKYTCRVL